MHLRKWLAALFLILGLTVALNYPPATANTRPGAILVVRGMSLTGAASIMTSTWTAKNDGIIRIQFENHSGGTASTPQVVSQGATIDLGTSTVATGDAAAFVWCVAAGDELNFTCSASTTASFKVFELTAGQ